MSPWYYRRPYYGRGVLSTIGLLALLYVFGKACAKEPKPPSAATGRTNSELDAASRSPSAPPTPERSPAASDDALDTNLRLFLGKEQAQQTDAWIRDVTPKTEFSYLQLKFWVSMFVEAGVPTTELDKLLAAAADLATRDDDRTSGMSKAVGLLCRAQSKGKVEMRALRTVGVGVDDLRILPRFRGKSVDQIRSSIETGSLAKDDVLTVIAGPDKLLGDLGLKAAARR